MSGASLSLPLFFEANQGQTDERVKFLARSSGYTLFVTPKETVFAGARTSSLSGQKLTAAAQNINVPLPEVLRMRLLHSNPEPQISGVKELPGKVNYLIGNNPRNWHTGVPLYEEVHSHEVYPGIDLVFHGDQQRLEYDFRVAPGADARRIQFEVSGARKLAVAEDGDLVLHAGKTEFRMRKPLIYQESGDLRIPVDGGFTVQGGKLVAFRVGPYDKTLPLVIDPTIVFSTFLGGGGTEIEAGLDLDVTNPSAPRLYVSGTTTDMTSFTETHRLLGNSPGAADYSFIAKIDTTTTGVGSLDYLTFIGGSIIFAGGTGPCQNLATGFHLDISPGAGLVQPVLLGLTSCSDFPVTVGGPTTGTDDFFVTRLTSDGTALDGSTLFGGNGSEGLAFGAGGGLFVGPEGTIIISAQTTSTNLPTTTGAYSVSLNNGTPGTFDDCFVTKLDRSFNILYLTYLNVGGNTTSTNSVGCGLGGVDAAGKIYMGGNIYSSTAFALANGGTGANGFQKNFVGTAGTTQNVFLAVLDPSKSGLSQLVYSTYLAGGGGTVARAGTVDLAHGILYVVGDTISNSTTNAPDIPLLNAYQSVNNAPAGQGTGFVTVMDTTKTGAASLVASTYFGGSTGTGGTSIRGVAFDPVQGNPPTQRLVIAGQTTATNFPTVNPLQSTLVGAQNGFVTLLSVPSSGSTFTMAPLFSTYLGGTTTSSNQNDTVRGLVTDSNHAIYALGRTPAANFFGNTTPATTVNGFQPTCASCGGGTPTADLAIFVLTPQSGTSLPDLTIAKSHSGNFTQGQTGAQYTITVTNSGTGPTVGAVNVVDALPTGLTATGITGTGTNGWTCSLSPLGCTRSDPLAAGASYPTITLTVNVSAQAPPSVTNTVVVSGGSETNTSNDTASDVTTITGTVGACTDNYTGASGGLWGTATNWSKGALPGSTDVACIPSGTTVVFSTAAQTISGLSSSGTLNLTTGSLTIANNSSANVLNLTGATLVVNGQFTVSGAVSETSGVLGGTGEFDFGSLFTWSGGFLCSTVVSGSCSNATNAVLNANAGISFPTASSVILSNRTVNVAVGGTWAGTSGSLTLENGAIINNNAGSVWSYGNESSLGNGGGTGTVAFNNLGTFQKTAGTATNTISAPFHNSGTVLASSGTLLFSGGGNCGSTCSGTYTVASPGAINFSNGVFAQSGPINGTGTVNFNGAAMDFGAGTTTISATTVNLANGVLGGAAPGVLNFTTPLNWSGGFICSALSGVSCALGSNATLNADAGINFPPSASAILSNRTVNVMGTTTWSGTSGALTLENGGVVNVPSGGVWNYANDSTLNNGGGTGVIAFNNDGTFEKTAGTGNTIIGVPFQNRGTVLGNSGTMTFSGGGNCGSSCPGTYTAASPGTITFNNSIFAQGGPINGTGTVNFTGATMDFGTGTTTISATTVNLTNGVLGGAAPGIINFSTPLTWTGGFVCSKLSGVSCALGTNGTLNANGGINFGSTVAGAANVALSNRTLNIPGTATWAGPNGNITVENGGIVAIASGGVWNYTNDSTLSNGGGTGTNAVNNSGTFEKTLGTATTTLSVPFHNSGTVLGNSGTMIFGGGGNCGSSCPGTYTAGTGGTINFNNGIFAQSGPINGTGTVTFSGATMDFGTGTTTISAATVNFTNGTLAGAAPGILNFTTPFTWTGGFMCSTLNGTSCALGTNATVNANGGINFGSTIAGAATVGLSNRILNIAGTATWAGPAGNFSEENGAVVNLASSGIWNLTNDSTLNNSGGTGTVAFNNIGNFEKTAGTGSSAVSVPFNNTGSVNGNSGTLAFSGGGNCGSSCSGTYSAGTGGTINFTSGAFAQSGSFSGAGTVGFTGATMDFGTGTVNVATSTVNFSSGTMGGAAPGILNFTNPLVWTGGVMCSSLSAGTCVAGTNATTNANGGITFSSNAQVDLIGRTLNTAGTTAWTSTTSSGDLLMQNGAMVTNSGIWDFQNDSYVYLSSGASNTFNNTGTFQKSGGTTTTTVGGVYGNVGTFNNTGHVSALVGQLNINGGGTGSGTWAVSSGAFLNFGSAAGTGTFALSGPFTGAGTIVFANDTENITGSYNITGATTVSGGIANFLSPATVTSAGNLTISSGAANFSTGNPVTAPTLTQSGGGLAGTDTVTITGATTWTGGTMCTTLSAGSCVAPTGAQGTTIANGGITFSSNAQLTLNGRTLNTAATSAWTLTTSSGDMLMENGATINNTGTWDIQNDSYVYLLSGASNTINNSGTFQKSGGTTTTTTSGVYGSDGTFNNTGHVSALAGQLNINGGGTGNGSWAASSGAFLNFGSGSSAGTFALSGPFTGAGTIAFANDTENITGSYNVTGATTVSGGIANFLSPATVTSAGNLAINSGAANFSTGNPVTVPTLILSGGNLAGTDTVTIPGATTWTGGNMCTTLSAGSCVAPTGAQGTTYTNGGITFSSNAQLTLNGRTLNTAATSAWTLTTSSGDMLMENGATINNTGTWDLQNDSFVYLLSGTSNTFNNAGTFQKSGGTTTTGSSGIYGTDGTFKNTGQVIAKAGNMNFLGTFTQTAGSTSLAGGIISTTTNPLSVQGGSVTGVGTVNGGINNTAGALAPGTTTPSITTGNIAFATSTVGTYAQSGTGAYNVKIGGTAAGSFDTLTATGAVTLGGALNVSLVNSFSPVVGNSFTIITGASVTNKFGSTNLPALTPGLGWQVSYSATTVILSVTSVSSPVANLNPGSLPFPNTIVNTPATIQKVQLQNTGTAPLTITSIVPTGTDAANYSYSVDATQPCPMSPATLANGASCMLDIGFSPLSGGTHNNAQITVTDNSGNVVGSTQTVSLSGTGITLSSITVAPATNNLPQGVTSQYSATGFYSDGSNQNLTTTATWASSVPAVASISNTAGSQGQAKGLTGGSTFITATQNSVTSNQATLNVTTATHFVIAAPGSATSGTPFNAQVFAEDAFNQVVTGYTGTVHFTSSDASAVLPANTTLTNGTANLSFTLKTQGTQTITGTDTVTASITGTSSSITVGSGLATHFLVSAPGIATSGTAISVIVTALDQFNNVATGYTGTVHITSSDAAAVLPANATLTSGTGTFQVTLKTVGSQTVTATDTVTSTITGVSNTITVSSGTATHFLVVAPPSVSAGGSFNVTVAALDQFNNPVPGYTGTVHITSSDGAAILPPNATLTSGAGLFAVTLKTLGSQTVTATDTVTASITGVSNSITVGSGAATHFLVSAPAGATAGTSVNVTVTALDQFNNLVTGYTGTVHFTSTDGQAVLPANSTLISGTGIFSVTLKTVGTQTVTATDTVTASITGITGAITVVATTATHLLVSAPAAATAGTPFFVTVTALDQFNNVATGYTGTVHFTSNDALAVLPANATLVSGTGSFPVTLKTAGARTVTATDTVTSTITGTSGTITVSTTTTTHFSVTAPAAATAGTPVNVNVTALDQFNNLVTGYTGTVHFTSTDAQAVLPANTTLTNGVGNFPVTLKTGGSQTVTATDTVTSSITGTTGTITVSTTAATHFLVTAPAAATAGTAITVNVTALDQFNNTVTGYTGTVHFTSTDAQAVLPANTTLTNGIGSFSVTLKTVGSQNVTATDTVTASITGTTGAITVSSTSAAHFLVTAPVAATAGTAITVNVTALDQFNNTVTGYTGTVHFTSTDAAAVLPANSTLTNGTGSFSATLKTTGARTVTATDTVTSSITGTTGTITVSTTAATHFLVTAPAAAAAGTAITVNVTALDQFNNTVTSYTGTVHFTSSDAAAVLPANVTLTSGTGAFQVTLKTVGSQTVTATDTVTSSITGTTGTITVSTTAATHFLVTAPAAATAGTAITVNVTALDQFNNTATGYTGTVHFTSTDGQAVLPANTTLTNGTGSFSVTLKTAGSQSVTATDTLTSSITGTTGTITVSTTAATHLLVTAPAAAAAGTAITVNVTALDQFNNTVTSYTGTVHFTSSDAAAVLPANATLTSGTGAFQVTLKTVGSQTVAATDTVTSSITGTTGTITVSTTGATHFLITAPAAATAGTAITVNVTALDQFNNTVTGYTGTVHFTSNDAQAVLPANTTLTSGTGSFSVTLKTLGLRTVTATDTVTSTVTGTTGTITVSSATATHLLVTAPAAAKAGTAITVNVTALDQFNNTVAGYAGTVHFTSTDALAVLPANATLTSGIGAFSVTLNTTGSQTVTATDTVTSTITGTTAAITVSSAAATHFLVTAPAAATAGTAITVNVTALDQFNNTVTGYTGTVHFTSSDAAAVLPANATLTSGTGAFQVTLKTAGSQSVTATDTVTSTITGSASVTVSAIGPTLQTITITPANPSLVVNGTQAFIAIGHYSDGSASNLTSSVVWSSGTTSVATITAGGVATGVSAGGSTISATLGGVVGSTLLTVTSTTAHAYVGDVVSANCCLDVIDISTNTIVKQIPVTNINEPLAITPDQSRVYVPDNVLSALDVIDTTTNTLVNTLPVGNGTTAVVITPNGKFGYVSDLNDGNVVVFNVSTSAVVATIPIGFSAGWIAITPDGAWVYAGSDSDGRMAVINTSTNTLSSTFTLAAPAGQPAPGCVTGPTFNPEGTLGYVALTCSGNTFNGNTVDVLSIPSNTVVATITVGLGPFQSAITPDGSRLYVANAVSNNVSVINTATNTVIATIPMPGHAESIAVTPDGAHVYVANSNAATVSVIQTSTNTVTATIATTAPFGIVIASPPAASAATTLTLTPPNLIFPAQVDGTPSASQTIAVKNPGATPVTLTSITLTGLNAGDFHLTNGCPNPPSTLGAGASCNLQFTVSPAANGQRIALVTINSTNGIAASTQSAPLSGTGISLVSIAVTPANPSVSATNTVQFTATGTYSDNSTQNITGSVNWTSSSTGIATINASGLATGVAAGGPITITATSGNIFGNTQLTVTPLAVTFPLNVTLIGTGTGSVTDNLGSINCVDTAGVISGTCSANYPSGTVVTLTANPTAPSTFGGWLQACTGTAGCSVTMTSAQSVTASIVPPPQPVAVNFTPGSNVSGMAAYDCPSNPNPSPGNPCLDPNAHANSVTIGQVITPFTLTVVATEVPPLNGNGICENGLTPQQDLDCRFKSFFTYQTNANGDTIVPICYPYANGNCVVYSVYYQTPGKEPDQSMYVGPITWNISFNNDKFSPPAPWAGGTPQLYYDPSNFVVPNSPYGTDCTTPMLIGNPGVPTNPAIYCQFVFDITTLIDPNKKVDFLIGGKSKNFSDTIVAIPPVFAPVVTVTTTPDSATVTAGSPIGFTIAVSNSAAATANNVALNTPLPGGTNVNWTITPAYTGQGTCSITGVQGSQILACAFGTMSPSTNLSLHIQSASSAAGTAISPSTVLVGTQQLLSVGSIVVQPTTVTFSGLTASQTIPVGTSSISLAGVIGNATQFVPSGETVSITINGVTQTATVGGSGTFSLLFPTAGIPVSATPYPITYSYAGDSLLSSAKDSSTTLTVNGGGEPAITAKTIGSGTNSGNYYVDVQITNTGTGVARNLTVGSLTFKTLVGTGNVTLNTALSPALPDNLGSFNVGASATVRLYLNAPVAVTRFMVSETGTVNDITGKSFAYSSAQVVSH